jgi:hypothetical protein
MSDFLCELVIDLLEGPIVALIRSIVLGLLMIVCAVNSPLILMVLSIRVICNLLDKIFFYLFESYSLALDKIDFKN